MAASANDQSEALTEQAAGQIREGDFQGALRTLREAQAADPADPRPAFYQGLTLNRLGRFAEALAAIERAEEGGVRHSELDFEAGWSLMRLGRMDEAIERLERYEQANPGRGQTSEFLGRAYLGKGEIDRAEELLKQAIERDPSLEPTVSLALASIERRRGNLAGVSQQMQNMLLRRPEAETSAVLRDQLLRYPTVTAPEGAPLAEGEPQKPWTLVISIGAGHDSNVIGAADGVPLPADISNKDSFVAQFAAAFTYDLIRTQDDIVTAGYTFQSNIYEDDFDQAELYDNYFFADWQHRLTDEMTASLRVADAYTNIGHNSFRNQISIRPAVSRRLTDWLVGEAAYTYGLNEYFFPSPAPTQAISQARDRDSDSHTLSLTGYFSIPNTPITARAGYYHLFNDADGSDYDYDSDAVFVGLSSPLIFDISGDVSYTHIFSDYDNANSFAGPLPPGFAFARDDDLDIVTARLTRPINDWATVFVRYDFINNDSNVVFFDYDQHVITAGVVFRW